MTRYLVATCVFNEGPKIQRLLKKLLDCVPYDILVIDDGSTDGSLKDILDPKINIVTNVSQRGAGHCIRQIFQYGREKNYEAVFFISGNDKDSPDDLAKIKAAIETGFDFVQGSRYIKGGSHGRMPLYRKWATRLHPLLFSFITGRWITDSTNGFRGVRLSMINDPRIDLNQSWLDQYELEPYLFYKAVKLGYKVTEVPVTKIYPPKKEGYSKMKPWSGWWSILRPLIYLWLGLKK